MPVSSKSAWLQIRVSPSQKAAIQGAARRAGMDMSSWVLRSVLPASEGRFQALVAACRDPRQGRHALAELHSWLADLDAGELRAGVASAPRRLDPWLANYVGAMVEQACARRRIAPPAWTAAIAPLDTPWFGSDLASLRLYLLTHSPPAFRRRNLFIDATVGARV